MEPGDPLSDKDSDADEDVALDDGGLHLNPNDITEVIEVNESQGEGLAADIDDMELQPGTEQTEGAEANIDRDDADLVFCKHEGSVFCVDSDPKSCTLAVSGGEDDKAYVWNIESGQVLFECIEHKDSVTSVSFSHDGVYVATGDMAGNIKVWKVATKTQIWSFETSDLEWLTWHHGAHVLFAGTTEGDLWMWRIPSGDCKTFMGHGCPSNIGRIMPDGKRAVVGYEDGAVKVWDLKSNSPIQVFSDHGAHESSITSLECHQDNTVIMTGSTDVTAKLLNTVTGKVLATLNCKTEDSDSDNSVEAVGFCHTHPVVATGTLKGQLGIWDMSTHVLRQTCKHNAGIVRLHWDKESAMIYTCTLDGAINLWDSRSGKLEKTLLGHSAEVLDMKFTRDGSHILTASDDQTVRVFKTGSPDG